MGASFSHYSILTCDPESHATLLFPGRPHIPHGSVGYVRSRQRAAEAVTHSASETQSSLPWRDYPHSVLTDSEQLARELDHAEGMLISARNVLNEFGYRARLSGSWLGRAGDRTLDSSWPVISISDHICMRSLAEAEASDEDILTGVPLVRDGQPCGRNFFLAHCSDVAHTYEVHPEGTLGPSTEAWRALGDCWEDGNRECLDEDEYAARLEQVAARFGAGPSRKLLHSLIGIDYDGVIHIVAITGALDDIARELVDRFRMRHAILLDNGGSVGWLYRPGPHQHARLLVAGPNRRPAGTVFLSITTDGFPHPTEHVKTHGR